MGRYTSGDIDHKFWFGIQSSDAASKFGGEMSQSYIQYAYGDMEDFNIETLDALIKTFNTDFDEKVDKTINPDWFYEWYNNKIKEQVVSDSAAELIADVQLGITIYQCILEEGYCCFEAEL